MTGLWIVITLLTAELQLSAAVPIAPGTEIHDDVTKLFTPAELQRAKDAGISDRRLMESKHFGVTLDELIELNEFEKSDHKSAHNATFTLMAPICRMLFPKHTTVKNYTNIQVVNLRNLAVKVEKSENLSMDSHLITICDYINQPDVFEMNAKTFGVSFVKYMKIHLLRMQARAVSDTDRIQLAKSICCFYKARDDSVLVINASRFDGHIDGDLSEFYVRWNEFETINTSKSLENVCDYLYTKEPSNECHT